MRKCAEEVEGVSTAIVDFHRSILQISYNSNSEDLPDQIAMAVENAGYTVEWGNGLTVKYFKIDGMFCGHCVGTVERALRVVHGVKNVVVNLDKHIATVIAHPDCNASDIIEAVSNVGYDATPYEGSRDVHLQIGGMVGIYSLQC